MPLKLVPPQPGRTPNYTIRGTYLKQRVYRSAGTGDRKIAQRLLKVIERDIESGRFAEEEGPTFAGAAISYMNAGGEKTFIPALLKHFKSAKLCDISQASIDAAARALLPNAQPATRNREVYTPISAILRHSGVQVVIRRPIGAQGKRRDAWLKQEDAKKLLSAAWDLHPRFAALCTFLLYTGCRLSEALKLRPEHLNLEESFAFLPKTKNGKPRGLHLPPVVVSAIRATYRPYPEPKRTQRLVRRLDGTLKKPTDTVFKLTKCAYLYALLTKVEVAAGYQIPDGVSFHIFRHTYGAWMRRYGGLDTAGLVGTGAWSSRGGAAAYEHVDASDAARRSDLFPGSSAESVREIFKSVQTNEK